ncbi:MAG: hypothetical protein WC022_01630 [Parcubacteria group bacterium]
MNKKSSLIFSIIFLLIAALPLSMALAADAVTIGNIAFTKGVGALLEKDGRVYSYDGTNLTYLPNGLAGVSSPGGSLRASVSGKNIIYVDENNKDHIIASDGKIYSETADGVFENGDGKKYEMGSDGNFELAEGSTTTNTQTSTNTSTNGTTSSCITKDGKTGHYASNGIDCLAILDISGTTSPKSSGGLIPCGHGSDPANACTLCDFIVGFKNLVDFGTKLLITVAVFGIFVSGFIYIISSGNEGLLTQAKNFLSASLIGFTIVLCAWLLVNVVMWALSYDTNAIIQQTNWYTFNCSAPSPFK